MGRPRSSRRATWSRANDPGERSAPFLGSGARRWLGHLLRRLDVDSDVDVVPQDGAAPFDHVVPGHAEVLPVDPGVRLEGAAVSAAVAWTEAEDVDVEHHRLGDAADRQVAGDLELVRGGLLHRGGLEGELRVLGDVEES